MDETRIKDGAALVAACYSSSRSPLSIFFLFSIVLLLCSFIELLLFGALSPGSMETRLAVFALVLTLLFSLFSALLVEPVCGPIFYISD